MLKNSASRYIAVLGSADLNSAEYKDVPKSSPVKLPYEIWSDVYDWIDPQAFVQMQGVNHTFCQMPTLRQIKARIDETFGGNLLKPPALPTDKGELLAFCNERLTVTSGMACYVKKYGGSFVVDGHSVRSAVWFSSGPYCVVELNDFSRRLIRFSFDGDVDVMRGGSEDCADDVGYCLGREEFLVLLKRHAVELYARGREVRSIGYDENCGDIWVTKSWFSPGKRFLFIKSSAGFVEAFDLATKEPKKLQFSQSVDLEYGANVSGDDRYLFVFGDGERPATLWDMEDGPRLIENFESDRSDLTKAFLSKTGRFLALYSGAAFCAIAERQGDNVRRIDGRFALPLLAECEPPVFTEDEKYVLFRPAADSREVEAGLVFALEPDKDGKIAMRLLCDDVFEDTPIIDDRYVVIANGNRPRLWDMRQEENAEIMKDGLQMGHGVLGEVCQIAGGRFVAFAVVSPRDGELFDLSNPERDLILEAHLVDLKHPKADPVILRDPDVSLKCEGLYYAPDGRCAVVTMWNGVARVWDLTATPKPVGLLQEVGLGQRSFSKDGRFFMNFADVNDKKASKIWDLKDYVSYF